MFKVWLLFLYKSQVEVDIPDNQDSCCYPNILTGYESSYSSFEDIFELLWKKKKRYTFALRLMKYVEDKGNLLFHPYKVVFESDIIDHF